MNLSYYYKNEADQFSFIRIPKALMKEDVFASLSTQAKILYGLLLDQLGEARKNKWLDEKNRVYVIYRISEIMEDMNVSKSKAVKILSELEQVGLVEKKHRGQGYSTLLYIKNFSTHSLNKKSIPEPEV